MPRLSELLVSTETFESDIQQDLLGSSKYARGFWDDFKDEDDVSATNMTFVNSGYSFTAGQSITSINLTGSDPEMIGYEITECYFHVDYEDSGIALLRVSANGGVNWEITVNDSVHYFTNSGTDLQIRFVGGGTGIIRSWSVLYRPDSGSYIQELANVTGQGIPILNDLPTWDPAWVGRIIYVINDDAFYGSKSDAWYRISTESIAPA